MSNFPADNALPAPRASSTMTIVLVFLCLLIGGIFSALMPPMKSFDEADHLRRAYMLTRGTILLKTVPCEPEGRFCQKGRRMSGGRIDSGLNQYLILRNEIVGSFRRETTDKLDEASKIRWTNQRVFFEAPGTGYYFPLVYAPQAIGLAIGNVLDLTIEHSYYLARFSSLLFSVLTLVLAFSMLRPPPVVLALLVLPMSLFQTASASIDTFSTALAVLAACCFIRCMQDGPNTSRSRLRLLAFSVFLIATSRTHLITMLLMPLAVAWRMGDRRAWRIAILTVAAVFIWLAWTVPTTVDYRVLRSASTGEVTLFYLQHPGEMLRVIARTLSQPGFLTGQSHAFIGHTYGLRFSPQLYDALGLLMIALALISIAGWQQIRQAALSRILLFIMGAVAVFLAFLAMLLTFTSHPAQTIDGVQGRYFLVPVLLMILALCDWRGSNRIFTQLRWTGFGTVLVLSSLASTVYMARDFYMPVSDKKASVTASQPLRSDNPVLIRLANLTRNDGPAAPLVRIGILTATWTHKLAGKARITFFDDAGRAYSQVFDLSEAVDNQYRFFDVPAARYVAGRVDLLEGSGGLSVWEVRHDDDDEATPERHWLSCARLVSVRDGELKTPGCL